MDTRHGQRLVMRSQRHGILVGSRPTLATLGTSVLDFGGGSKPYRPLLTPAASHVVIARAIA